MAGLTFWNAPKVHPKGERQGWRELNGCPEGAGEGDMIQNNWPNSGSLLFVCDTEAYALQQAMQHARNILCHHSKESAALLDAESHPDFRHLYPEEGSQWIKIDQVRALIQWTSGTPQIAQKQVAIISKAHTLNLQAANALLKTVEEPSLNTVLILVSHKPALIPATLKSRCFWVRVKTPASFLTPLDIHEQGKEGGQKGVSAAEIEFALKKKISLDLNALFSQKNDAVTIAATWAKEDPKALLRYLLEILHARLVAEVNAAAPISTAMLKNKKNWGFIEKVLAGRRAVEAQNPPNVQLLLESLLCGINFA